MSSLNYITNVTKSEQRTLIGKLKAAGEKPGFSLVHERVRGNKQRAERSSYKLTHNSRIAVEFVTTTGTVYHDKNVLPIPA